MKRFHVLLSDKILAEVDSLPADAGGKRADKIRSILTFGLQILERKVLAKGDAQSKYRKIDGTPVEKQLQIDEKSYRRIKRLHVACNYFSMAQIVRGILLYVLELIKVLGFDVVFALSSCKNEDGKKHNCVVYIGLAEKNFHMDKKAAYKTAYTDKFIPIWAEFT